MARDGLLPLDPRDDLAVGDAARLHAELLPTSPIARLGDRFMRGFYYRRLVADGLLRCDLFYHEGEPAGFLAYTAFPADFMSRGLRRHPVSLATTLLGAAIREPRRVRVMLETVALMRARQRVTPGDRSTELAPTAESTRPQAGTRPMPESTRPQAGTRGELLSFGVLPAFRSREYARRTGRRVSVALVESALAYFRARGLETFQANVDPANRETLFFYHALGCRFEQASDGHTVRAVGSLTPPAPEASPPRAAESAVSSAIA